jgi:uncharacterized OsmC-like protein
MNRTTILTLVTTAGLLCVVSVCLFAQPEAPTSPSNSSAVVVNGLDTHKLSGMVNMLENNPDKGRVTFYSNSRWQDGMRAFTIFNGYKIDGQMHHQKERKFVLLGDEGVELSGTDTAPGAVEEMMYALGTCIVAAANANAALMGVTLDRLEVNLESDLDLHGLFAVDEDVRAGVQTLRATIIISGDADDETLNKIAMAGYRYSPVSETLRNGISFTPSIEVSKP